MFYPLDADKFEKSTAFPHWEDQGLWFSEASTCGFPPGWFPEEIKIYAVDEGQFLFKRIEIDAEAATYKRLVDGKNNWKTLVIFND